MRYHYVLSEKCNMNCTYCNVDKQSKLYSTIEDFNNYYSTINDLEFDFDIFGGEPFLYLDIVNHIVNELTADRRCRSINITTNGTITNPMVRQISKNSKVHLTISYDGMDQITNRGIEPNKEFYISAQEMQKRLNAFALKQNGSEE